ncbi:methylmalonyl Co-A mutase-associated GTPase MeaB [Oceaniserpentilla sp. 4NH20-0058]|uniref:methylmalonyl Co-A mutase-associated GTPase MeaB n=1 Tax=Oceaniserpentilla sp. 4NH20-0058 TaxID=3127660 RepID=UPI003106E95E
MININDIKSGNRRALAKAITLVESKLDNHREQAQDLLNELLPATGKSIRIGITGIPGVGKSTFIEAFGLHLIAQGKKVAVLAVDPSSPLRGGSILGDKTRMELLSREQNAYIRPSPSEGALGGVAQKTRETMLLCEAAGFDVILVETIGVGQSEYEVAAMVDFFLVLMLPNAGDELQGIKRGIMELADALVINKADGESINLAKQTQQHYKNALHLLTSDSFWQPQVKACSAIEKSGIHDVWGMISEFEHQAKSNGFFEHNRAKQTQDWLDKLIQEMLTLKLKQNPKVNAQLPQLQQDVLNKQTTPYNAAQQIIKLL